MYENELLHLDLPRASWLWTDEAYVDPINRYVQFHRSFRLEAVPPVVPVAITADQTYRLWVNGERVGRGPARGYQSHWPVDTYDVAAHLRPGENTLAAEVHNPGTGDFSYRHAGAAGFLAAVRLADGLLVTDAAWRCRDDPARVRWTGRLSKQRGFQEQADLRLDDGAWRRAAAAELDASWRVPRLDPFGARPWDAIEPRGLPPLTGTPRAYDQVVGRAEYAAPAGCGDPWPGPTPLRPTSLHFAALAGASWSPAEAADAGDAGDAGWIAVPQVETGRCHAVTLVLDEPTVGELVLEYEDGSACTVDVLFSEAAEATGRPVLSDPDAHSRVDMATRLALPDGGGTFHAFQLIGHRAVTVIVIGPAEPRELRLHVCETRYPLEVQGTFETDSQPLADIHRVSVSTQRNCMLDAYVDTPWREQAQWWGDARVQALNTFALADDRRLLVRGLRQIGDAEQQTAGGLSYGHAPTIAHTCVLPDFACVWMTTIWEDWFQSGDTASFEALWPRVQRLLGYFERQGLSEGGLIRADPRYWLFLDWAEGLPRHGCPALLSMMLLEALEQMLDLARRVGLDTATDRLRSLAEPLRAELLARLWDPDAAVFRDGLEPDGSAMASVSLHTQVQAMLTGLTPPGGASALEARLRGFLTGAAAEHPTPSPFWMTYVYEAARRCGLVSEALGHLVLHWSPMVPSGGTWERFEPPGVGDTTASHAWSAHPIHHLPRMLCGIVPDRAGWEHLRFEPHVLPEICRRARATVPTPHGPVTAGWRVHGQGSAATVTLELPPGITATASARLARQELAAGSHEWVIGLDA